LEDGQVVRYTPHGYEEGCYKLMPRGVSNEEVQSDSRHGRQSQQVLLHAEARVKLKRLYPSIE
jgi:hypothetical protein